MPLSAPIQARFCMTSVLIDGLLPPSFFSQPLVPDLPNMDFASAFNSLFSLVLIISELSDTEVLCKESRLMVENIQISEMQQESIHLHSAEVMQVTPVHPDMFSPNASNFLFRFSLSH